MPPTPPSVDAISFRARAAPGSTPSTKEFSRPEGGMPPTPPSVDAISFRARAASGIHPALPSGIHPQYEGDLSARRRDAADTSLGSRDFLPSARCPRHPTDCEGALSLRRTDAGDTSFVRRDLLPSARCCRHPPPVRRRSLAPKGGCRRRLLRCARSPFERALPRHPPPVRRRSLAPKDGCRRHLLRYARSPSERAAPHPEEICAPAEICVPEEICAPEDELAKLILPSVDLLRIERAPRIHLAESND